MHSTGLAKSGRTGRRRRSSVADDVIGWAARCAARRGCTSAVDTTGWVERRPFQVVAVEVGVVEEVEEVHAELDPEAFFHRPVLRQLGVHIRVWRAIA